MVHTITDEGLQVDQEVVVSLAEVVDCDGLKSFLDLLDELTRPTEGEITNDDGEELDVEGLQEPEYEVLGLGDEPDTLRLRVTGHRDISGVVE